VKVVIKGKILSGGGLDVVARCTRNVSDASRAKMKDDRDRDRKHNGR